MEVSMHGQDLVEDALDLFFLLLGPLLAELFALGHICVEVYVITFIDSASFSLFFVLPSSLVFVHEKKMVFQN